MPPAPHPAPIACAICRRRKVRCDKGRPCGNCVRMHMDCVYLPMQPRQRRNRSGRQREMLERLRKLEGMVAGMDLARQDESPQARARVLNACLSSPGDGSVGSGPGSPRQLGECGSPSPSTGLEGIDAIGQLSESFGRLEVRKEGSMWFSNDLMARFHAEAGGRRTMTVERCEEEEEESPVRPGPSSVFWPTDKQAFDPLIYLPPRRQIPWYWDKFVERVDPLTKVLHVPTVAPFFLGFDARSSPVSMRPLFFAVCYCVVCSLRPDECAAELGDDREVFMLKYKTAAQQALGASRFLATQELRVLQALVLLLSYVQGREAEELWTLSGLTIRIAQHMGLHREGEGNGCLSPFAAEMRRRLWWQICVLDVQISEVRGAESFLLDLFFDTRMPLNIRDGDLDPEMTALPEPRKGCTEMTWSLITFEMFDVLRRIARMPPGKMPTDYQKSVLIADFAAKVEEQFLAGNGTRRTPLLRCNRAMFRFLHCKFLLLLHRPFRPSGRGQPLSQDVKDSVFEACLEALESWYSLTTDATIGGRSPGFKSNSLLQPLVFVLLQLCDGRRDALAERAWNIVMAAQLPSKDGSLQPRMRRLIGPVRSLLDRARRIREFQLQQLRLEDPNPSSNSQAEQSLPPDSTQAALAPTSDADVMQPCIGQPASSSEVGRATGVDLGEHSENLLRLGPDDVSTQLPPDLIAWADELPGLYFPDNMMWLDFQGFAHPPS